MAVVGSHWEAWGDLLHSVQTGETAFDARHGSENRLRRCSLLELPHLVAGAPAVSTLRGWPRLTFGCPQEWRGGDCERHRSMRTDAAQIVDYGRKIGRSGGLAASDLDGEARCE
jgi:hypothetical protein